jgi:hypothetical protein
MSAQEKMKDLRGRLSNWMGETIDDGWWEYILDRCRAAKDGYKATVLIDDNKKKADFEFASTLHEVCLLLPYYDNPVLDKVEHTRETIKQLFLVFDKETIFDKCYVMLGEISEGFESVVIELERVKSK